MHKKEDLSVYADDISTASQEELATVLRRLVLNRQLSAESVSSELNNIREETDMRLKRAMRKSRRRCGEAAE